MAFQIIPAHQIPLAEQARIFTEAFTGYIGGSFAMDGAALARLISAQAADLCHSHFVQNSGGLCGFGYVSRIGDISRLCGMGVIAGARRTGAARALLRHLLAEAKARGDRMMVLEVIEQNPAAHALYCAEGFRAQARLCGWRRLAAGTAESHLVLEEVPLIRASQISSPIDFPDLPWQISRYAVAKLAAGRAYSSGGVLVVFDESGGQTAPFRLCSLSSTGPEELDWAAIRETFAAVLLRHAGREFFAPAIFPEIYGLEVFGPLGFQQEPITQFLMRHEFEPPDSGFLLRRRGDRPGRGAF